MHSKKVQFQVLMEKDEDGFFIVECSRFQGGYTQGKTIDEALKNIREVIRLCLEEQKEEIRDHIDIIQEFNHNVVSIEI
ncbi:MAG: type II toxin-antitoxin system HicB family antitoxin [Methanosarcinales archaeon]|nr:type II toxin-antitoxin system HicB family antitoxin [Methanosarcinales archaeon]